MEVPEREFLSPDAIQLLASSFDLSTAAVTADAERVLAWRESNDDLLVWLEQRHQWPARTAARYLRNMRFVLGQRPENMDPPPET